MLNDLLRYHNVSIPSKYNTQLKTNKLNDLKIVCIHIFNSIMNNFTFQFLCFLLYSIGCAHMVVILKYFSIL